MRIDEFSDMSDSGAGISTEEQARFLLFGFDILPVSAATYLEIISFNSLITKAITINSLLED